jgi:hypothetical protein
MSDDTTNDLHDCCPICTTGEESYAPTRTIETDTEFECLYRCNAGHTWYCWWRIKWRRP